jgi:hypothetical protein
MTQTQSLDCHFLNQKENDQILTRNGWKKNRLIRILQSKIHLTFTTHYIRLNELLFNARMQLTNHESSIGSRVCPTFYDVGQEHIY